MKPTITEAWEFGGPLAGAPPETAWLILALATALCALVAWISYRLAVRRLNVAQCFVLVVLRMALLVALLFCLANPVRIERTTAQPPDPPPPAPRRLAVVVDRSDSMTKPDNRGRSRLDDALVTWHRLEPAAQSVFAETEYYSFAKDLRPAATLAAAAARTGDTSDTRLYQSVAAVLDAPPEKLPEALVVLTDGLDTSDESDQSLRDRALAAGIPLYFVAGHNRDRAEPFLRVREWRSPGTAMRNTEVALEATFEAFSREDRTVPFSLWQGDRRIFAGKLLLTTGANLVPWSFPLNTGEPGLLQFTLRLGEGADATVVARSAMRVLDRRAIRVLVYEGALDWSYRYLADALRTDTSFEFAMRVDPGALLALKRPTANGGVATGRLPDDVKAFNAIDCLVLAHPNPSQFTAEQQLALVEFARGGGSVLFLSPDPEVVPQFAGSPLQQLLPVVFGSASDAEPESGGTIARWLRQATRAPMQLAPFTLTETGRASPIFARADGRDGGVVVPRFAEFAPVARAKPGAEVLAVHPTSRDPATGQPHILLATETFGRGRSTLLASDALWRWKLNEPSDARVVETFWQQLLLAIGRRGEAEHLQFTNAPAQVRLGQTVALRLASPADKRPVIAAKSPAGKTVPLAVSPTPDAEGAWNIAWKPDQPGAWEIAAGVDGGDRAFIFPTVLAEVSGELARTSPALESLRALAGATGGALLTFEPPAAWRQEKKEKPPELVVSERHHLRWNRLDVLWAALGLYAAELILRRLWKLL